MELRPLGRTGLKVSPLCLGTMTFGSWGNSDAADCVSLVSAALDAGINFIDTADVYSWGGAEEIVGKALAGQRDDVILTSKFHYPMDPSGKSPHRAGNSRRWIMRAVEDSLRRLRTDYLDIYQVHRPDPDTGLEETLSAMSDLVRAGKVRVIGTTTFPAQQLVEAQWIAERRGLVRFGTEQPPYSILNRSAEAAVLPTCEQFGIGAFTWSPMSEGWLTGRYQRGVDMTSGRPAYARQQFDPTLPGNVAKREAVEELTVLAAQTGCPLTQLALAFARNHPAVTSVIVGPSTLAELQDVIAGATLSLSDDVLDRIDQIVPPGSMLNPADSHYLPPALSRPELRRR